ncbi:MULTISPECIES: hypothetical protein [Enterococcus]|uniref:hypothetical protein n=1 Tax=Enterococcus TaxID=1350 RepID=UPI000330EBAB|nr:hypothetical protein [Enterococcus casseliflavus]EOH75931.1 hypothetical protein UAM_03505 [Enterococcus casseliflavus ATCC 49996]EOU05462.1 hypothetical protein I582_02990 [Enterococcus casseliflavus ATCC 49996]QQB86176.1 hypothetical protein I6H55_03355 [Enterococcus casseliflavus]
MATIVKDSKVVMRSSEYEKFMNKVYQNDGQRQRSKNATATAKRIENIKNLIIIG